MPSRRHRHIAEEILDKAAVLFDTQGYGQAALQDIADAVGIARPSIYHYFRSKEEILSVLVDRTTGSREEIVRTVRAMEADAVTRLRALLCLVAESIGSNAVGLRLTLNNDGLLPVAVRRRSLRSRRELFELLVEILAEGRDAGALRPLDERAVAATMIASLSGLQYRGIGGVQMDVQEAAEVFAEMVVRGVMQPAGRQAATIEEAIDLLEEDLEILERHARRVNGAQAEISGPWTPGPAKSAITGDTSAG
ncbi:MAG TPA: TetR/AcrR family transcriptional regulator [Acidimicrobiales bacterium]|nr:TetR/AcrR family transcriptional regulator [Acidimicrobiales bacterium]